MNKSLIKASSREKKKKVEKRSAKQLFYFALAK
jgi:hypothetical protein